MIRTKQTTFRLRIETGVELAKLAELLQAKVAAGRVSQADAIAYAVSRALADLDIEKKPREAPGTYKESVASALDAVRSIRSRTS